MSCVQQPPQPLFFLQPTGVAYNPPAKTRGRVAKKAMPSSPPRSLAAQPSFRRTFNGCVKCKQRHVKCDLTKPSCQRCLRRGEACEYVVPRMRQFSTQVNEDNSTQLAKTAFVPATPPRRDSQSRQLDEMRCKVLAYIDWRGDKQAQCTAVPAVPVADFRSRYLSPTDSTFQHICHAWMQLDESYAQPHVALDPTKKAAYFEAIDKALVEIQTRPFNDPKERLAVIDYFQGFIVTEMQRTLDIVTIGPWLYGLDKLLTGSSNDSPETLDTFSEYASWLRVTKKAHFCSLLFRGRASMQAVRLFDATFFGQGSAALDQFTSAEYDVDYEAMVYQPPPDLSRSLHALASMLVQFRSTWVARFVTRANERGGWRAPTDPHLDLMMELEFWTKRYALFTMANTLPPEDDVFLQMLNIHRKTLYFMAFAFQSSGPAADHAPAVSMISAQDGAVGSLLADCESLIHHAPSCMVSPFARCPGFGIIPPLFFVATKCEDANMRQRALELLETANVYENGWHSRIAFHVASILHHTECEAEMFGLASSSRQSQAYLYSVGCSFDDALQIAHITLDFSTRDPSLYGQYQQSRTLEVYQHDYEICRQTQWPLDDIVETFGYASFRRSDSNKIHPSSVLQIHYCQGNQTCSCNTFYGDFYRQLPISPLFDQSVATP